MTASEVRTRISEYGMSQDVVAHFAGTTGATVSKYLRGLGNVSDDLAERISTAVSAMASMAHYYDGLPIAWSQVEKLTPIVKRYIQEHRAYLTAKRANPDLYGS